MYQFTEVSVVKRGSAFLRLVSQGNDIDIPLAIVLLGWADFSGRNHRFFCQ